MKNFLSFLKTKKSSGIFVPYGREYIELKDEIKDNSINGITRHLGYKPIEAYTYFGDFNPESIVRHVVLEIFTENIIFVLTKDNISKLDSEKVKEFMKKFKPEEEYGIINIKDILLDGIEEKSFEIGFLSRVLNLENPAQNGIYRVEKLGVNLSFAEGILVSFKLDNELGEWARHFKSINPELVANYARVAKIFWGEDYDKIFDEVNLQFEALANTPEGVKNKFIDLHREKYGTINFFMLIVCHYGQKVNLEQFETINKGRFKVVSSSNENIEIRSLGNFFYEFDENGILMTIGRN